MQALTFGTTRLFRNNGNGTVTEVTNQDYVATAGGGRAGGFVDYNNDGFLDTHNYTGLNSVLQSYTNHWIGFTPVGRLQPERHRREVHPLHAGRHVRTVPLDQG